MSIGFLRDTLACVLWVLWFAFVVDVVRTAMDVIRGRTWPELRASHGPVHAVATMLVGTAITALLLNRAEAAGARTAPVHVSSSLPWHTYSPESAPALSSADPVVTATVRPPEGGVHDSLWRIAVRSMGDGGRWPEIYKLNRGRPQADGEALSNPDLIRPGWILQLPDNASSQRPDDSSPSPPPPRATPSPPGSPSPSAPHSEGHSAPGLELATGAYVGLGLAALIGAAAATVRLRRRARYRPGSGERDDLTMAPVVRALRVAGDREVLEADSPLTKEAHGPNDGRSVAWHAVRSRGLGMVGAGASDAARALLVAHAAEDGQSGSGQLEMLIPAGSAEKLGLVDEIAESPRPPGLCIVADLSAALDVLEAELLSRVRQEQDEDNRPANDRPMYADLLLVAQPTTESEGRLQSLLENGAQFGLAGVLLGEWRSGRTLQVEQDGIVSADSSPGEEDLTGVRLFTLPAPDARAVLDLLREANPEGSAAAEARSPKRSPGERAFTLAVLGPVQLAYRPSHDAEAKNLTHSLAPKQREILAYLALHRDGARREALTAAIWPDAPSDHPYNSFHATLSQFRRTVRTLTGGELADVVRRQDGRYVVEPGKVSVDLWELQDALTEAGMARSEEKRREALHRGIDLYTGDLASDVVSEWCEAPREAVRRDVLDAVATLTRALSTSDPSKALALLERATKLDRYNEAIYRDIARVQARLGLPAEIPRTLTLLGAVLAEVDEEPSRETIATFEALQRRGSRQEKSGGSAGR
ncbi:hypothetical protein ACTWJ8_02880 [Streptomyces sp. SDT5-1]|uniref:hypothetical protein n=1 Tax=Streptomyces sp. SDT5-1 TaxID=3406418 RepID=UPI003FD40152